MDDKQTQGEYLWWKFSIDLVGFIFSLITDEFQEKIDKDMTFFFDSEDGVIRSTSIHVDISKNLFCYFSFRIKMTGNDLKAYAVFDESRFLLGDDKEANTAALWQAIYVNKESVPF